MKNLGGNKEEKKNDSNNSETQKKEEERNKFVMLQGTPVHYYSTGENSLSFIDESGSPVLLKKEILLGAL